MEYFSKTDTCVESSWISKSLWKRSLRAGCLSKSLNKKPALFSRTRELTRNENLGLGSILDHHYIPPTKLRDAGNVAAVNNQYHTSPPLLLQTAAVSSGTRDSGNDVCTEILNRAPKSTLIVEDISVPPGARQEVIPLLLTAGEFFAFTASPEWGGSKSLRLVDGHLLQSVQTALYALEANGRIDKFTSRVYLNNGGWEHRDPGEDAVQEFSGDDETVGQTQEWISEKILVDMTHYSKAREPITRSTSDASATKVLPNLEAPITKLSGTCPHAHRLYPVSRIRIPAYEMCDPLDKIDTINKELNLLIAKKEVEEQEMLAAASSNAAGGKVRESKSKAAKVKEVVQEEEPPKLNNKPGKGNKEVVNNEDIDDIAEDPFLVPEGCTINVQTTEEIKETSKRASGEQFSMEAKDEIEEETTKEYNDIEESGGDVSPKPDKEDDDGIESAKMIETSKDQYQKEDQADGDDNNETRIGDTGDVDGAENIDVCPSEKEVSSASSESDTISRNPSKEEVFKQLYLSGKELYVSTLYSERGTNAQSIARRLQSRNKARANKRYEVTNNMFEEIYKRTTIDMAFRFKCLAAVKEKERIKAIAPKIPIKSTKVKQKGARDPWLKYRREQEETEMRVATDSCFERGFQQRIGIKVALSQAKEKNEMRKKDDNSTTNENANSCDEKRTTDNKVSGGVNHNCNTGSNKHNSNENKTVKKPERDSNEIFPKVANIDIATNYNDYASSSFSRTGETEMKNANRKTKSARSKKTVRFTASRINEDSPFIEVRTGRTLPKPHRLAPLTKIDQSTQKQSDKDLNVMSSSGGMFQSKTPQQQNFNQNKGNYLMNFVSAGNRNNMNSVSGLQNDTTTRSSTAFSQTGRHSSLKSIQDKTSQDLESNVNEVSESLSAAIGPTESEIYVEDYERIAAESRCKCFECVDDEYEMFKCLRPECQQYPYTYPKKLACLRRSFQYLKSKEKSKTEEKCRSIVCLRPDMSDECVRDELFDLLEKLVVRKEILVSSLGNTFTTFVFTKQ